MRTIEIKLFQFSELSEKAKETALNECWDYNLDNWHESTYEDAENIGLKITGFDVYNEANGRFIESAETCANLILKEHGDQCETYKTAKMYLDSRDKLVEKYSDGVKKDRVTEENEYDFDNDADEQDADFLQAICEDYRIMLRNEYEYQQSDEAVKKTIEANEYEFTEDGKRA